MYFTTRQIENKEFRDMTRMMKAKDDYIRRNHFPQTYPIFDVGDEVGVFYHVPRPHHKTGTIVKDEENGVTLRGPDGLCFRASVFQVFHLTDRDGREILN